VSTRKNIGKQTIPAAFFRVTKRSLIKKLFLATITFPDMIPGDISGGQISGRINPELQNGF